MIFLKLIYTNLRRHRIRTFITLAGIAFSVAAMLTVVTILQGAVGMFSSLLSAGSEMVVFEKNISDLFFSSVPDQAVKDISTWPMVKKANPVLFGIVSSAGHPLITCFGIDSDDARLKQATWLSGSAEKFNTTDSIVLGERAAEFLNAQTGEEVAIGHGKFHVTGVLRTRNGFEDGGVFMPLTEAQEFFHKQGIASVMTIKLNDKNQHGAFKERVKAAYPELIALEDEEFNRSYSQFKILKATAWAVGACGMLLGGLGIANTMIMSVFTRIREIAILRVNGFSNSQIAAVILGEAALVAMVGAVVGLLIGFVAIFALKHTPALHGYVDATVDAPIIAIILFVTCVTGVLGALYPAGYAMRVRPVEALRFE